MVRRPRRPAPPPKPLTKAGKIVVIVFSSALALAVLIGALTHKDTPQPAAAAPVTTKTSPTYKTGIVTFTYKKGDGTPWPWKIPSITVTCTTLDGDSTAVVDGKTYGITGREAIHDHLRGRAPIEDIALSITAENTTYSAFMDRVYADCKAGMVGQ